MEAPSSLHNPFTWWGALGQVIVAAKALRSKSLGSSHDPDGNDCFGFLGSRFWGVARTSIRAKAQGGVFGRL